ncbi:hypothetical protein F4X90_17735 [Candidatus Poribacteria bacterium]|nr:hypothetical protein [Candidatus Poribacteria bacterium]
MRRFLLLFLLLIACFSVVGCSDNVDFGLVAEQLQDAQAGLVVQTTLPDDVLAAMQHEADEIDEQVKRIFEIANRPNVPEAWIEKKGLLIEKGIADDEGNVLIDFHAQQKAFYTKYIDAAGIAIVAPNTVEDVFLLAARDAIVLMTSKHPELRERLLSKHGKFYMILVADDADFLKMPELQLNNYILQNIPVEFAGTCDTLSGYSAPHVIGNCFAEMPRRGVGCPVYIFIHEFAHVLHLEMDRLKPGFDEQVREAYAQSLADFGEEESSKYHMMSNHYEYWAVGTERWMRGDRENLFKSFPRLVELLEEWYPAVDCVTGFDIYDLTVNSVNLKIVEEE